MKVEILERTEYTLFRVRISEWYTAEMFILNNDADKVAELLESNRPEVEEIRSYHELDAYLCKNLPTL